jgi:rhodanese-related sulfurtransferase
MKTGILISFLVVPLLFVGCSRAQETTAPPITKVQPTMTTSMTPQPTNTQPAVSSSIVPSSSKVTTMPPTSVTSAPPVTPSSTPSTTVTQSGSNIPSITVDDLYNNYVKLHFNPESMVTENPNYVTVDAREIEGWNGAHIPAAISIVPNIYNTEVGADAIKNELIVLPKDVLIVFYDDFQDLAPALAQEFLDLNKTMNLGYNPANVKVLAGGFNYWSEKHYPTMSAEQ